MRKFLKYVTNAPLSVHLGMVVLLAAMLPPVAPYTAVAIEAIRVAHAAQNEDL